MYLPAIILVVGADKIIKIGARVRIQEKACKMSAEEL